MVRKDIIAMMTVKNDIPNGIDDLTPGWESETGDISAGLEFCCPSVRKVVRWADDSEYLRL